MGITILLEALKPLICICPTSKYCESFFSCFIVVLNLNRPTSAFPYLPDLSFTVWTTLFDLLLLLFLTIIWLRLLWATANVNSSFDSFFLSFPSQPENIQPSQNKFTHKLQVRVCTLVGLYCILLASVNTNAYSFAFLFKSRDLQNVEIETQ